MLTLLIETSTERGAVFLFDGDTLAFEGRLPPGLHNSTDLLPAIERGLKAVGASPQDIAQIGVGIGPGSYTGLRVGAMAAKALSYARKIPLAPLCSLECFASGSSAPYATVIDAKIGGAYLLRKGGEPLVCALEELPGHLEGVERLVTPNKQGLERKLALLFPGKVWEWEEAWPDPVAMYRLTREKLQKGCFTTDGSVELQYMRKTQAEIEREAKGSL